MESLISYLMRPAVWKTKVHLWSEARAETVNFKISPLKAELSTFNTGERREDEGRERPR